ncbi:MAG: branched-chain amino acid ABC transporter permease [Cryobacterium sp.]|nr:branched-chain amino acid ABC transporter permease [Cryobacterium sp.]MBX3521164.1 branched-chain amino acid ABC transporter permease [Xanthobacteraceae bacterium]MBX3549031.1 branched-chain amino acid ABC transporter permease [Xanthobacteraceae bacterium]MCW5675416.1 branched-chain amino acid ABC transporter permease [Xanthobacteraceae bacterium]MCW5676572.1 branched-chain amino acid ABC transporter permease [Xanthobacteraceae bacterium]
MFSFELLFEAVVFGLLVGCFYAAISLGLSIAFGLLDVPHIAHAAFLVLAAYMTFLLGSYGLDPLVAAVLIVIPFFFFGVLVYRFYYEAFEKRGADAGVRGIAFFFGIAFLVQVFLSMKFGLDQRTVSAPYIGRSLELGDMRIPWRLIVVLCVAIALTVGLKLYLSKTFQGRAIRAVAQDAWALRIVGANPVLTKQWAFGIATAAAAIGGALLIIVSPVEPSLDRVYIGRTFCVVVLAGLGSMSGTLVAGLILGVIESLVLTMFGASWAPAVAYGLLLLVLAIRPQGLFRQ